MWQTKCGAFLQNKYQEVYAPQSTKFRETIQVSSCDTNKKGKLFVFHQIQGKRIVQEGTGPPRVPQGWSQYETNRFTKNPWQKGRIRWWWNHQFGGLLFSKTWRPLFPRFPGSIWIVNNRRQEQGLLAKYKVQNNPARAFYPLAKVKGTNNIYSFADKEKSVGKLFNDHY